jgi:hypothetical protein
MNDEINGGPDADTAGEMSIADSLRAAWDAAESAPETTEPTTTDTDPAPSREDGRDERGRFAAKQAAEAAAADPETAATAPVEPPAPTDETPAAPATEAPQHWAAADKELFAKLPPDGQKFLVERHKAMEGDYTRRMQEIAPLRKAAEQWTPYLQQMNATPEQAFNHLLQAEYQLRTGTPEQKQALFQQWARDYDIPLGQTAQQPAEDQYIDPQVAALKQELAEIKAWRSSRDQAETHHRQQQEQQQLQTLRSTIDSFETEKTEAGAPAHPHFQAVRDTMAVLMSSHQASDLKAAYDMAVWARPDLRQQLISAQQEAAVKKAAEEAKAKARQASTAAASVTGRPVGQSAVAPASSVREELERAWSSARA